MGKAFKELVSAASITASYIYITSLENTDQAFKVTIQDLKDYLLNVNDTNLVIADLSVGTIRSAVAQQDIYVDSTTLAATLRGTLASADEFGGRTNPTSYIEIDPVLGHMFHIDSSETCRINSSGVLSDSFKERTFTERSFDMGSEIEFFDTPSTSPFKISATASRTDRVLGKSVSNNYVDLVAALPTVTASSNDALSFRDTGEFDMPNRTVVVAWGNANKFLQGGFTEAIPFPISVYDPFSQYIAATSVFEWTTIRKVNAVVTLSLTTRAWENTDSIRMWPPTGDAVTPDTEIYMPMAQGSYFGHLIYKFSFQTSVPAAWTFRAISTKDVTVRYSWITITPDYD